MPDFVPQRENDLIPFSENFKEKTTSQPTEYGLSAVQAAAYAAAHDQLVAMKTIVDNPLTKSPTNVELKNEAKRELIEKLRLYAGIATRSEGMTNAKRIDLGLRPRDFEPSPKPIPNFKPTIMLLGAVDNVVSVRVVDPENPNRRGLPEAVDGIALFSYVGETAPTGKEGWVFEANLTRTRFDVVFPNTVPAFSKVFFTAFYFNDRKQSGPAATPVSMNLPGSVAMTG